MDADTESLGATGLPGTCWTFSFGQCSPAAVTAQILQSYLQSCSRHCTSFSITYSHNVTSYLSKDHAFLPLSQLQENLYL